MLVYNETGKTKSGELRITRPISSLLIRTSKKLSELANEKITIFIEKANGNNVEIATNISLVAFMMGGTYGESGTFQMQLDGSVVNTAMVELSETGSVLLGENESIKILLTDLTSTATYAINGMESPIKGSDIVKYERKVVLTEDVQRKYDVSSHELMILDGVSHIDQAHITYNNGETIKLTSDEIKAVALDVDVLTSIESGAVVTYVNDIIVFPLVGVDAIELFKSNGLITLTLKDANLNY
ncbi:structural protein [Cellulophaga phage phi12a:1]|uniref:Structural protein n=1 Tax=Cellulophaga phage phi12a:1 TaxID=1327987 RepID=R9ZZV1_9VIRU|nr:structural protein [Cellulophaga phage phi12a:1]AGO48869.1 structural protein [Cellulophaga phage phi12a:1]